MTDAEIRAAQQSVAEAGRELLARGLVARTWGNVSCRLDEQHFAITPSGLGYAGMSADDIVICNMQDNAWSGTRPPSSEKGVHQAAYRCFPGAGFVIHTHQTYASALSVAGFSAWRRSEAQLEALGGLALASYGHPGSQRLSRAVRKQLEAGAHTILMAHHGALIVGCSREEAFDRAVKLEELCRAACCAAIEPHPGAAESLAALTDSLSTAGRFISCSAAPALVQASMHGEFVPAQLDDMAQMLGRKLLIVPLQSAAVAAALQRNNAVLVRGAGAVFSAATADDLAAMELIAEKASICWLHSLACGETTRLSRFDAWRLRRNYRLDYQQKINAQALR